MLKLPILEYEVHAAGSFFFRVDILRGSEEGEDALEVAAEDVTGVEGLFEVSRISPFKGLVSILPFSSNLNPFTINMLFSTFGIILSVDNLGHTISRRSGKDCFD